MIPFDLCRDLNYLAMSGGDLVGGNLDVIQNAILAIHSRTRRFKMPKEKRRISGQRSSRMEFYTH